MEGKREISQPVGSQSPTVTSWRQSLRNIDQKQGGFLMSNSLKGSSNGLRKSTGNLAASLSSMSGKHGRGSSDLERIEAEYIKNLQQQVYFLELEANYLREQARKATEMHPQMSLEAERMLSKLRHMQGEVDGLHAELKRRDSNLGLVNTEKERIVGKLKAEEEGHTREKRLLLEEIVQLKKQKDLLERDSERKDNNLLRVQEQLINTSTALKAADNKIDMIKHQLDQKIEQNKLTEGALQDKRAELLKTESQLREIEDKYYSSTSNLQEKLVQDLRDEIRLLRQRLKETEMSADQDRYLRNKLSDDSAHLVKENALLNQQVLELQKQVELERSLREGNDTRRSHNITELVLVKDREKSLQYELNQVEEQLRTERNRVKHYMEQIGQLEQQQTQNLLHGNTTESRLQELQAFHKQQEQENSELRRDKMLLIDHVAELQKKLDSADKEVFVLQSQVHGIQTDLKDLGRLKQLETTLNSQKWEEFSRLAESMKNLSRSMANSPSPSHSGNKTLDYS